METAGYSATPLAKKLGIKPNNLVQVFNSPKPYLNFFSDFPKDVVLIDECSITQVDVIHFFAKNKDELRTNFLTAKNNLKKDGILWISWPKKSSSIISDLDKFFVLNYGQENGLVDVKVAAIDQDWSGHKFVYRLEDRK